VRQRVAQVHQVKAALVWLAERRLAVQVVVLAQMVLQQTAQLAVLLTFQVLLVLQVVTHQRQRVLVVAVRQ
jgi:hypothetical protein